MEKPAFKGRAALERELQQGVTRSFATLVVDAGECDAPYMSTVWRDAARSSARRPRGAGATGSGASIALAMVRSDLAAPGTGLEVEIYGERRPAVVQPDRPLYDPENAKLRS